jgi:DNA-directed RNA polymerase specialized sigma24 family protein
MSDNQNEFDSFATGDSVSEWLDQAKRGNCEALGLLWKRYYDRIASRADSKLPKMGHIDGSDVAAIAFECFYFHIRKKPSPELTNRNDIWKVLISIVDRKIVDTVRKNKSKKRGGHFHSHVLDGKVIELPPANDPVVHLTANEEFLRLLNLLNPTEKQIAIARLEGFDNKEIADMISKSDRTVVAKLTKIRLLWEEEKKKQSP